MTDNEKTVALVGLMAAALTKRQLDEVMAAWRALVAAKEAKGTE